MIFSRNKFLRDFLVRATMPLFAGGSLGLSLKNVTHQLHRQFLTVSNGKAMEMETIMERNLQNITDFIIIIFQHLTPGQSRPSLFCS